MIRSTGTSRRSTSCSSHAKDGDQEPLKQFAADTAPTVQQHLDKAKALRKALDKPEASNATSH